MKANSQRDAQSRNIRKSIVEIVEEQARGQTRDSKARQLWDFYRSMGFEMPPPAPSIGSGRLIRSEGLNDTEVKEANDRAWREEFDEGKQTSRTGGSLIEYSFRQALYMGETALEKRGLLDLFRKTQSLPDYSRAEEAVKRGWGRWIELEFGIKPKEARDKLKIRQFLLLHSIRAEKSPERRREWLRSHAPTCFRSALQRDDGLFRLLGKALADEPRKEMDTNDFTLVLLHNWLTRLWWIMPIKAVAVDFARLQRQADESAMIKKYNQRLWQTQTRATGGGGYFSQGWIGVFYSSKPSLISCLEPDWTPVYTPEGGRLRT